MQLTSLPAARGAELVAPVARDAACERCRDVGRGRLDPRRQPGGGDGGVRKAAPHNAQAVD
eukprot:1569506-Pyramimonas_sp.AAC.1